MAVWRGPHVGRLKYLGSGLVLYGEVPMWVGGMTGKEGPV